MKIVKISLNRNKGIILIICLILLLALTGIGMTVATITVNESRAAKYRAAKEEATQKAQSVALYAIHWFNMKYPPGVAIDLNDVSSGPSGCNILDQANIDEMNDIFSAKSDSSIIEALNTYACAYPHLSELQGGTTSGVAAHFIIFKQNQNNNNKITLRVVAYATDSTGKAAAVNQMFIPREDITVN